MLRLRRSIRYGLSPELRRSIRYIHIRLRPELRHELGLRVKLRIRARKTAVSLLSGSGLESGASLKAGS